MYFFNKKEPNFLKVICIVSCQGVVLCVASSSTQLKLLIKGRHN